jgi:hypothetical protein
MRIKLGGALMVLALATFGAIGFSSAAHATGAMHCGNSIVTRGDPAAKALHVCGQPSQVEKWLAPRQVYARGRPLRGFINDVVVEEWTYNFGRLKLMRVVRIENGVVAEIRTLGRGF